jgi:hypothetical protein
MGKLNIFNLGERGVILTKDPIHTLDGDLTQAQNALRSIEGGLGGVESRPGMSKVNAAAMTGGAVLGFVSIPYRDPGNLPLSIYGGVQGSTNAPQVVSYDNGATWRTNKLGSTDPWLASGIALQLAFNKLGGFDIPMYRRAVTIEGRVVYAADGYLQYPGVGHTAPLLGAFDGVLASELTRVPYSPSAGAGTDSYAITCLGVHDGVIYLASWDEGAAAAVAASPMGGRVFSIDTDTGALTQVGNAFGDGAGENPGGLPVCLHSHMGRLWAGTYDDAAGGTGKVWWIRPGVDDTWTLDHTTAANCGYIVDLVSYEGELFALTLGASGTASLVLKRATSGTWSTSDTNTSTAANNAFTSPIVYQGELFVWMDGGTASSVHLIRRYDGVSWTTDADLNALFGFAGSAVNPGMAVELNDDVFIAHDDGILQRHLGTWSRALNLAGQLLHGELAWTNVEYS